MKKIFFGIVVFVNIAFYGQPPGGGNGGGRRSQGQESQSNNEREIKKFSASDVAGIFYYDIEEIIKKLKLKDENKQAIAIKALKDYNLKIKEISFLNSKKFSDLDVVVNSLRQANDREASVETRKKVGELIGPIKDEIRENERQLNETLESILSEKQQKKWLKYQKNKKESLQPKRPDNENRQGTRMNEGGMRRQ